MGRDTIRNCRLLHMESRCIGLPLVKPCRLYLCDSLWVSIRTQESDRIKQKVLESFLITSLHAHYLT